MISLGQKLLHIAHRDRWVLFSRVIEPNGQSGTPVLVKPDEELERPFQHPFFQEAENRSLNEPAKERNS